MFFRLPRRKGVLRRRRVESEQSHHWRGSCGQISVRQRSTIGNRSVAVLFVGPDRTLITGVD